MLVKLECILCSLKKLSDPLTLNGQVFKTRYIGGIQSQAGLLRFVFTDMFKVRQLFQRSSQQQLALSATNR